MKNPVVTGKIRVMIGLQDCKQTLRGLLTVSCMLIGFAGCGSAHGREVMVIGKTRTYHRQECAPVHMAKAEEMTVSEAKARHFKPCPVCKPDSE